MSTDRVRTTSSVHLSEHPEATFRVRHLGRTTMEPEPIFTVNFLGDGTWEDAVIYLTLSQLRQLRFQLGQAIEPAVAGLQADARPSAGPVYGPGSDSELVCTCGRPFPSIAQEGGLGLGEQIECPDCGRIWGKYRDGWLLDAAGAVSLDEMVQRG